MKLHLFCPGHVGQLANYWKRFDFIEVQKPAQGISTRVLSKWRREAPEHCQFVAVASLELGRTGFVGEKAEELWKEALADVKALKAPVLLLRTDASFRPSTQNRDAIVKFFETHKAPCVVAWAPEGLWEMTDEDTIALCERAGLLPVIDPLSLDDDEEPPAGRLFYWRLMGRKGMTARFSDFDFDRLLGYCEGREEGYIALTAPQMMRDAARLGVIARQECGDAEDEDADDSLESAFGAGEEDEDDSMDDADEAGFDDGFDDGEDDEE